MGAAEKAATPDGQEKVSPPTNTTRAVPLWSGRYGTWSAKISLSMPGVAASLTPLTGLAAVMRGMRGPKEQGQQQQQQEQQQQQ